MRPAPSTTHQKISLNISGQLWNYLKGKNCNIFTAPFDVRLSREAKDDSQITTVVQPNICVICDNAKIDSKGCLGALDIIVEILLPGNNRKKLKKQI